MGSKMVPKCYSCPNVYLMNGVKSPKTEAVNVVRILSSHGNVTKNTTNIATIRGAKENVWSWIEVSVWIRLIATPTMIATASIGATIHMSVVSAPCMRDVIKASSIMCYITLLTSEVTIRYQPSTMTNSSILNGIETITGGSCIIPIDSRTLETARSIIRNGRKITNPI